MTLRQTLLRLLLFLFILLAVVAGFGYAMFMMPGVSHSGPLPPLTPAQAEMRDHLRRHVQHLAGEIGERNTDIPGSLQRTVDYLLAEYRGMGLSPHILEHSADGKGPFSNVEVELYGTTRAGEILIIGAHYDTVWLSPGADDNASGVAGMLEIARTLADRRFARTVRFVAFPNEEFPYFGTDNMGSKVYARRAAERDENIVGMFSLEMLGYYDDRPGSQQFPGIMDRFYPDRADFIAFVSNLNSRPLLRKSIASFRTHAEFPSEGLAAPATLVPDVTRSDHAMFWAFGFPGIMITDTAGFRNPHYHMVSDMPDTLDYERMAQLVSGLADMIADLAGSR